MASKKTPNGKAEGNTVSASGAGVRKRRSSAEIRERLIRAASDEFRKFGFAGATTAAIARRAEVTEAQLFRHFATKADLFRDAVFEPLNAHFAAFNAEYLGDASVGEHLRDRARNYVEELQAFLEEHSELLLSLIVAQTFTSGSLQGVGEIDSLRAYFDRGATMMTSRVDPDPAVDPALLVRVSFAALLGCVMFKEWIFPPRFASEKAINGAVFNFLMDGINVNTDPGMTREAPPKKKRKKKT